MRSRHDLQILLMQIRDDDHTRVEEFNEFVRFSGLHPSQLTVLNVFETPDFEPSCMAGFDALFIGGSSDASVTKPDRYPFVVSAQTLLLHCLDAHIPVFASCFGFQVAVVALGGEVQVDKANMEMGTYPMQLTEVAQQDPLFEDVPTGFWAVSGHQERAMTLPEQAVLLAYTDRCPYHAFRIADRPFYAFQFHPEIDPPDLAARITRYKERYLDGDDHLEQVVQSLQATPIANQLIGKFVDRILLPAIDRRFEVVS